MTANQLLRQVLDYGYEDLDDIDWPEAMEDRLALLADIDRMRAAVVALGRGLRHLIAEDLGSDGWRQGEVVWWTSRKRVTHIIDPPQFAAWLGDDLVRVIRLDGAAVRRRELAAVAKARDVALRSIEDTFLDIRWGEPELRQSLAKLAPAWLGESGDGLVTRG